MNRELRVEDLLRTHPGVSDVAVIRDHHSSISAFVVPNDAYIDDVLGRRSAALSVINKWRKVYDLTQLAKDASSAPVGFNTLGWNSSYTRKPIPNEEMREWLKTTVEDVLNLRPKYVYEVGCGTGMLLMKIAPCCEHYVGSDFAPAVLCRVREQLLQVPTLAKQVQLTERTAEDFDGLEQNSFDTVILNSVVQHFPTAAYLTGVLEKAARIIKDDGSIFIGDVLSLPLLPAFAASVASFQGPDEISLRELRDLIQRRIEMEQHLILSPAYFLWFQHQHSIISRVEIRPRRDRADNEM